MESSNQPSSGGRSETDAAASTASLKSSRKDGASRGADDDTTASKKNIDGDSITTEASAAAAAAAPATTNANAAAYASPPTNQSSLLTQHQHSNSNQQHVPSTPPKISLPPGQHHHVSPAPQIGPGWTQQMIQRRTPSGPYGKVDRYFVSPRGRKLRSMGEVYRYLNTNNNNSASAAGTATVGSAGSGILHSGSSSSTIGGMSNAGSGGSGGGNGNSAYKNLRISASAATTTTTGGSNSNSRSSSAVNSPRHPLVAESPRNLSPKPPPTTGPGSGKGIDVHPFSRGSVIEVRYVKREKVVRGDPLRGLDGMDDDEEEGFGFGLRNNRKPVINWDDDDGSSHSDWFGSSSSSSEEEEEEEEDEDEGEDMDISDDSDNDNAKKEDTSNNNNKNDNNSKNDNSNKSDSNNSNNKTSNSTKDDAKKDDNADVYLADIIDRLPLHPNLPTNHPSQSFKYYIHYRNFNRRMDEWISYDRIVSPPSVGNARVRAIKRKEDRRKRDQEERKERERILKEGLERGMGHRRESAARNRSLDENLMGGFGADLSGVAGAAGTGTFSGGNNNAGIGGNNGTGVPRKRLRRAASTGEDLLGDAKNDNNAAAGSVVSTTSSPAESEDAGTRSTRRQRRGTNDAAGASAGGGAVGTSSAGGNAGNAASSGASGALRPPTGEEPTAVVDQVTTIAAQVLDEHEGMDAAALKEHEEVTKIKNVGTLELGKYQMDTWYFSPLPKELTTKENGGMIEVLYVDEFSLNFFTRKEELLRYQRKTLLDKVGGGRRHPPGNEIYRCGNLSMFEVDGFEERLYCQNLCYIAKLFLDHKTLYFDVDPFLFYVLCEVDERGYHPVGYYSKEKYSDVGYNLACILTFPSHQRKGYGRFLIAFSYELSKKEEKVGSPEKPMSDLGQQAYIPYWTSTIVDFLLHHSEGSKSMSIMDIAKRTSIMAEDIIFALNTLGVLKFVNGAYFIYAERTQLEELTKKHPVKEPRVNPSKLHWTPYITDVKRDKFSISSKKASVEAGTVDGSH